MTTQTGPLPHGRWYAAAQGSSLVLYQGADYQRDADGQWTWPDDWQAITITIVSPRQRAAIQAALSHVEC